MSIRKELKLSTKKMIKDIQMKHNLKSGICPLTNKECTMSKCIWFNIKAGKCESLLINSNLYTITKLIEAGLLSKE